MSIVAQNARSESLPFSTAASLSSLCGVCPRVSLKRAGSSSLVEALAGKRPSESHVCYQPRRASEREREREAHIIGASCCCCCCMHAPFSLSLSVFLAREKERADSTGQPEQKYTSRAHLLPLRAACPRLACLPSSTLSTFTGVL